MDSFELTKIAGGVLSALLLIFGAKTVIEMNTGHAPEQPGYTLPAPEVVASSEKPAPGKDKTAVADAGTPDKAAPAPAGGAPGSEIMSVLAKANADNGKAVFSKCKSCHVADKGKPSTVGPNLWGVVNRKKGSVEGFGYSEGMKSKGGEWKFEDLANFLNNPKGYVPGTKMVFNGLPAATDRADVIAYLATLADTPVPLPK